MSEALAAIEAELSDRTRLVALSHVAWTTGAVLPVAELAGRNFRLLVDGAQSVGAIPVDVRSLGCDFYTVSGQKWLLGPDTTGALYVRPGPGGGARPDRPVLPLVGGHRRSRAVARCEEVRVGVDRAGAAGRLACVDSLRRGGWRRTLRAGAGNRGGVPRALRGQGGDDHGARPGDDRRPFGRRGDAAEIVSGLAERGVVVRDLPGLGWIRASCGFWTSPTTSSGSPPASRPSRLVPSADRARPRSAASTRSRS